MTDAFANWAADRGGFFTRSEAKDYGYSDSDIQGATREGYWLRLRHGYYAYAEQCAALEPRERHCLTARAVLHKLGDGYVLAGPSACAALGIDTWGADPETVHVVRASGRSALRAAGVQYHDFPVDPSDVVRIGDISVLRAERAVWQASCGLSTEGALVCMNSALHRQVVEPAGLEEVMQAFDTWPGSRTARLAHRMADGRIETVGESRTFFLCWEFHLPRPEPQYAVYDEQGRLVARTDFAWLEHRHVCEFDGKVKYLRYLRPGESVSDAVLREKHREDRVREQRLGVSRVVWIDLYGPTRRLRTAHRLDAGLEQSKRLYTRNRVVIH